MSSCWKCGKTLPGLDTECEYECFRPNSAPSNKRTEAAFARLQEAMANRVQIDWTKIKTADDLLLVVSVIFQDVRLDRDSRAAHFLARYLKQPDSNPGAEPQNPT